MENPLEEDRERKTGSMIFAGCSCLALFILLAGLAVSIVVFRNDIPAVRNYFPTPTATLTPVPGFMAHEPPKGIPVLKDDFSSNKNDWSVYYMFSKAEVRDGKLFLESFNNDVAIAYTFYKPVPHRSFTGNYYFQADLSTENSTQSSYGLVFGLTNDREYYSFTITPSARSYALEKVTQEGWVLLTSDNSAAIKPFPNINTAGVYFDRGKIELFVNGQRITTYQDKDPLGPGRIGVISKETGSKLIIDNVFAYNGQ